MLAGQSVSYDQPNLCSADKAPGEVSKYIVVEDHSQVVEDYSPKHKNLREILDTNRIPPGEQQIYSHRDYDKYTPLPDPYETAKPETPIIILQE